MSINKYYLPKEIAHIIGKYTLPKMWLYMIYEHGLYAYTINDFRKSHAITANNRDEALFKIFKNHASLLLYTSLYHLNDNALKHFIRLNPNVLVCDLSFCRKYWKNEVGDRKCHSCIEHLPSNYEIMNALNITDFQSFINNDVYKIMSSHFSEICGCYRLRELSYDDDLEASRPNKRLAL